MALIDQYTLSRDQTFQQRCEQAVFEYAGVVLREASTVAFHAKRAAFAKRVVAEPAPFGVLFASALATVPAIANAAGAPPIQGNVTDAQIRTTVLAAWDDVAGSRE